MDDKDIDALLASPKGAITEWIWARYGDAIKDRVARKAIANGWTREGNSWVK